MKIKMFCFLFLIICFQFFLFLAGSPSFAERLRGKIYFNNPTKTSLIKGLTLNEIDPEVIIAENPESKKYEISVLVQGKYTHPNSTLEIVRRKGDKTTKVVKGGWKPDFTFRSTSSSPEQPISLHIFLNSSKTLLSLKESSSPTGSIQDSITIEVDEKLLPSLSPKRFLSSVNSDDATSSMVISLSIGTSLISYSQNGIPSFSELLLTPKIALSLALG